MLHMQEKTMKVQQSMLGSLQKSLNAKNRVSMQLMEQAKWRKAQIARMEREGRQLRERTKTAEDAQAIAKAALTQAIRKYRPQSENFLHCKYMLSNKVQ